MKKAFLIAALVVAAMPSMAQGLKYSVSGIFADEGKKVYLMDRLTETAIDSMVVTNGKFAEIGSQCSSMTAHRCLSMSTTVR